MQGSSFSKGLILKNHSRHPSSPRFLRGGKLILTGAALLFAACDEAPARPPSQEAVEQAWQRADKVSRQAAEAEQQVRHARRLRDIDRVRYETAMGDGQSQLTVMRGLLVGLGVMLFAALSWLAIEIRRRRVLSVVIHNTLVAKED